MNAEYAASPSMNVWVFTCMTSVLYASSLASRVVSIGGGAARKTSPCHGESPCACPPAPLYWLYIYVTEVHIYAVFFH